MSKQSRRRRARRERTVVSTHSESFIKQTGQKTPVTHRSKRQGTMATWICTPFGILMPGLRPEHTFDKTTDPRTLQVRCREKDYIDRFRELYCPDLGEANHFPHQDYPWKAYVTPDALATAVARMILDTDSEIFKPLAEGPKGLKNKAKAARLHSCYSAFWSTHLTYGDGTSSFDLKASGGISHTTGPERCSRFGHWFTYGKPTCQDCGEVKPDTWKAGDRVYPSGTAPQTVKPTFPGGVYVERSWGLGGAEAGTVGEGWEDDPDDLQAVLVAAVGAEEVSNPLLAEESGPAGRVCAACYAEPGKHKVNCFLYGIGSP
jgi:hypothetical protein